MFGKTIDVKDMCVAYILASAPELENLLGTVQSIEYVDVQGKTFRPADATATIISLAHRQHRVIRLQYGEYQLDVKALINKESGLAEGLPQAIEIIKHNMMGDGVVKEVGIADESLSEAVSMSKLYPTLDEALEGVRVVTLCLGDLELTHGNMEIKRGLAMYSSDVTAGTLLIHGEKLSVDDDPAMNELIAWREAFNLGLVQQAVLMTVYDEGMPYVEANTCNSAIPEFK